MTADRPNIDRSFDGVVIGGGPAGMSAAMWFVDLGMSVCIIEKEAELGGLMLSIFAPITNYLGLEAANGREMRDRFAAQLSSDITIKFSAEVKAINAGENFVECSDENIGFKALIYAAGVRRRMLPAVQKFNGSGVMFSGSGERKTVAGQRVVIVGGGDAALENALILGEYADEVTVVHRREEFSARAEFVEKAEALPNVKFLMRHVITELNGAGKLESVIAKSLDGEACKTIEAERILVRIGTEPNSELLRGLVETDPAGFIITDITGATGLKNIYAAGDVANPTSPTIISAAGTAAAAAKAVFEGSQNTKRKISKKLKFDEKLNRFC